MRPYWPGRSRLPGLGKSPAIRIVPVPRSLDGRRRKSPLYVVYVCRRPDISSSCMRLRCSSRLAHVGNRRWKSRYSCSLTVKYALIGSTCDTEVEDGFCPTRLPDLHARDPGDAITSEVTLVKPRFICACSTLAFAGHDRRLVGELRLISPSSWLCGIARLRPVACRARHRGFALPSWASACASCALA